MTGLDLTAFGAVGITLTGAAMSYLPPESFMAAAGSPGVSLEMVLLEPAPVQTAEWTGKNQLPHPSNPDLRIVY
ncbi:MAG: hypothetical protein B7Z15_13440 [Rhizobiales bacterium 32-66-8]|nr:MAG: hypothetical protein B7Z15_13440 [Rhizobiales bacterium 32-66-8]